MGERFSRDLLTFSVFLNEIYFSCVFFRAEVPNNARGEYFTVGVIHNV